jgi:hypothetical protein
VDRGAAVDPSAGRLRRAGTELIGLSVGVVGLGLRRGWLLFAASRLDRRARGGLAALAGRGGGVAVSDAAGLHFVGLLSGICTATLF